MDRPTIGIIGIMERSKNYRNIEKWDDRANDFF